MDERKLNEILANHFDNFGSNINSMLTKYAEARANEADRLSKKEGYFLGAAFGIVVCFIIGINIMTSSLQEKIDAGVNANLLKIYKEQIQEYKQRESDKTLKPLEREKNKN